MLLTAMPRRLVPFLAAVLAAAATALATGAGPERGAYVFVHLDGTVDLGMAPLVKRAVKEAKDSGAEAIFVEINTLGGRVDAALLIRDALLEAGVPTTTYVNKRAISAGALICLATDAIDMAPGSTVGAATPVMETPEGGITDAGEKMTSYLRKEFSATAEAKGRRTDLAEAMVDRDRGVDGVVDKGKLLTLTTEEAVKLGLAARSSESLEAALAAAGLEGKRRIDVAMNWAETVARGLTHPVVAGLLLTLAFVGLTVEIKAPGWGLPGTVGLLALVIFFAGHQVVLLAGWEDLALILLGLVLLALEVFVVPGFGVVGILGIVSLVAGLLLAMTGLSFRSAWTLGLIEDASITLAGAILATGVALPLLVKWLPRSRLAQRTIVLGETFDASQGVSAYSSDLHGLVGRSGVARSPLRPAGTVVIDDRRVDAVSEGEVIEAGRRVVVVDVRGASVVVRTEGGA
jgi:membrane-bound serine protease (ClpP class)